MDLKATSVFLKSCGQVQQLSHGKHSIYCTLRRREVTCANQAEGDVIRRVKSDKHKKTRKKN